MTVSVGETTVSLALAEKYILIRSDLPSLQCR